MEYSLTVYPSHTDLVCEGGLSRLRGLLDTDEVGPRDERGPLFYVDGHTHRQTPEEEGGRRGGVRRDGRGYV